MSRIVVVDDDRSVLLLAQKGLEKVGHTLALATNSRDGLDAIRDFNPDVVLLDLVLREGSGLEVLRKIQNIDRRLPVIIVTAEAASDSAIEAIQLGAYDYVSKPLDLVKLAVLVEQAVRTRELMNVPVALDVRNEDQMRRDAFLGQSPQMLEVFKIIGRVAGQNVSVLVRGESGTGKELVARAVYQHSDRADRPFMEVNCAALPDALLESELFGHEKGAFTGADTRRIGKFEQCDGGTIFLDEIGDMALAVQAKVLRLLQEQRFERVGGNETIQTDVRIITATNRNLEEMVERGDFRTDLMYRLNGVTIQLPPLRDRPSDIRQLIQYFLTEATKELGHPELQGLSPGALDLLLAYPWPGNVRELRSMIRQSVLNSTGPVIAPEFLPKEIKAFADPESVESLAGRGDSRVDLEGFVNRRLTARSENLYAETVEMMERFLITRVLQETDGNQSKAAEILGITRGKIRDRIATFNINVDKSVTLESPD